MSDLGERLRHAAATAANDDLSDPMTRERARHVNRFEAMTEAADEIESLRARITELEEELAKVRRLHGALILDASRQLTAAEGERDIAARALGEMRKALDFVGALDIAKAGYLSWAVKPHNRKWVARVDGTPIPNDLLVCIATQFAALSKTEGK